MLGWSITLLFIIAGLTVVLKPVFTLLQKRCGSPLIIPGLRCSLSALYCVLECKAPQEGQCMVLELQLQKRSDPEAGQVFMQTSIVFISACGAQLIQEGGGSGGGRHECGAAGG